MYIQIKELFEINESFYSARLLQKISILNKCYLFDFFPHQRIEKCIPTFFFNQIIATAPSI